MKDFEAWIFSITVSFFLWLLIYGSMEIGENGKNKGIGIFRILTAILSILIAISYGAVNYFDKFSAYKTFVETYAPYAIFTIVIVYLIVGGGMDMNNKTQFGTLQIGGFEVALGIASLAGGAYYLYTNKSPVSIEKKI